MFFSKLMRARGRIRKQVKWPRRSPYLYLETLEDRRLPAVIVSVPQTAAEPEYVTAPELAVALSTAAAKVVTVNYAVSGGTAKGDGADYTLAAGKLTFQPGDRVKFLPLTIVNHNINEPDKTIQVSLSGAGNALLGNSTLVYTIVNDAAPPTVSLSFNDPTSGPEGKNAAFAVTLSAPSGQTVTVHYATTGAVAGKNFLAANGILTFQPGQTKQTITLKTLDDHLFGNGAAVQLGLSQPTNATLGNSILGYTINNIDPVPSVAFTKTSGSGVEGQTAQLRVALSAASSLPAYVNLSVSGTAQNGVDYSLGTTSLTFGPSQTVQAVPLSIFNSQLVGSNKSLVVTLSNPTNATLGLSKSFTYMILEQQPVVGFASAAAGAAQTQNGSLQVVLSKASSRSVTVHYAVSGGTARSGSDFTLKPGILTFQPGQTSASISFAVVNHPINEADKTVQVTLSSPGNAYVGTAVTVWTIQHTVPPPSVSFAAGDSASGAPGKTAGLSVNLSAASGQTVTVHYAVTGGTAVAGTDYKPAAGTLTFLPGRIAQTINLSLLSGFQPDKTVVLSLSNPVNATLVGGSSWTYTIVETRPAPAVPAISFAAGNPTSGSPGTTVTFTVGLSVPTTQTVTVQYAETGGSAAVGTDYAQSAGTLTFRPGQKTRTFTLKLLNDHLYKADESVELSLANPVNGTLGGNAPLVFTIHETTPPPKVAFAQTSGSSAEGQTVDVPVTLSAVSGEPVTVTYAASGGSAQNGVDYALPGSSLTFPPGQTVLNIPLTLLPSNIVGPSKSLQLTLAAPQGAVLGTSQTLTFTIQEEQPALNLILLPAAPPGITVTQAASGVSNQNVTVSGQVTDAAGLEAVRSLSITEGDGASYPVTFDGAGNFSFTTRLPLDGNADGAHALVVVAADWAGKSSSVSAGTFTLDTQGPAIAFRTPASGLVTGANVTVTGTVTDSLSSVTSVQAQIDSLAPFPVAVDAFGGFDFSTDFALDGSADGNHTLYLTASNSLGNVSHAGVSFVLQSQMLQSGALALTIATPVAGTEYSNTGRLIGSAGTAATTASFSLDGGAAVPLTLDGSGSFDQPLSATPLIPGTHHVMVTASDSAGHTVQQTITFMVSTADFTIGAAGSAGWGSETNATVHLEERDSFVVQSDVSVLLGGSPGARIISFTVNPQWDLTGADDRLLIYLQNPSVSGQMLLSSSGSGALFSLSQTGETEYLPGLVRFDGSVVQIDVSSLSGYTHGLLVFQLVGDDSGTGSVVDISNLRDVYDLSGNPSPVYQLAPDTMVSPGPVLTLGNLTASADVTALISNVALDPSTGLYTAELRVLNNGADTGADVAVVFPNLPAGVTLENPSGTGTDGSPYVNMQPAFASGGLAGGATSDAVKLTFSDKQLLRFALTPQVLVSAADSGPTLSALGPLSVAPGGYLAVPLHAGDPNGGPITYSLQSDGPLPGGTIQQNGTLIFQPSPADVGTYNFTVVASSGLQEATQPVTLTVAGTPGAATSISGVVKTDSGTPVSGLTVEVGSVSAVTDGDGSFTVTYSGALPDASLQVLANQLAGPASYAGFSVPLDQLISHPLYTGYSNQIPQPIYLAPLDTADAVTVNPQKDVTVTTLGLPGASLLIPAGSLRDQNGNLYTGKVSLTPVPVDLPPEPFPAGEDPGAAVMLEPVDNRGTQLVLTGGTLTLPNVGGYAPGTPMQVMTSASNGEGFDTSAGAVVSQDGKSVICTGLNLGASTPPPPDAGPMTAAAVTPGVVTPDAGGQSGQAPLTIIGYRWVNDTLYPIYGTSDPPCDCQDTVPLNPPYIIPTFTPVPPSDGSPPGAPPGLPTGPLQGSGTTVNNSGVLVSNSPPSPWSAVNAGQQATAHGSLEQDQLVSDYQSQGQNRQLVLHYSSIGADPTNIVHLSFNASGDPDLKNSGARLVTSLTINAGNFSFQTPGAPGGALLPGGTLQYYTLPANGQAEIGIQANTSNLPTGVYTYTLLAGVVSASGDVLDDVQATAGTILVVNSKDSPFGSGWGLSGWEEVVPGFGGTLLLVDGDGTRLEFRAPKTAGGAYTSPPGDYSTLVHLPDGSFQRTMPDQTVYTFNPAGKLTGIKDPNGNLTQFNYNGSGNLISMVDPVGEQTAFGYAGGAVDAITTPDGRTTSLQHDAAGNLTALVMPDGAVQRYGYNGQHLLTSATDPDGNVTQDAYNFAGRIISATNAAGDTIRFSSPDTADLPQFALTLNPATAPLVSGPQPFVETVTDGDGNVTTKTLNSAYEVVSWHDATGAGQTFQRTNDLITSVTDGNGNVTHYTYQNGNVALIQDSLSDSAVMHVAVGQPGDQNTYTFNATAGEQVYYESIGSYANVAATLTSPSGASVGYLTGPNPLLTLTEGGTYTLSISSTTGTYNFAVVNTASAMPLALNTPVSGQADPATGAEFYDITGSAGERLHFHSLSTANVGGPTLFTPSGSALGNSASNDFTLPVAGTYLLVVSGQFGFEVDTPSATSAPLTLGTPATATIATPGDQQNFTFSGQAGQRIYFDDGTAPLSVQISAPDGSVVFPVQGVVSSGPANNTALLTLGRTGAYTVSLSGDVAGAYPFTVTDVAAAPSLSLNEGIQGDVAAGAAAWSFSGNAGQQLQFYIDAGANLTWTLYGTGNQVIAGNNPGFDSDLGLGADFPATCAENGTYVLTVRNTGAAGPTAFEFWVKDVTQTPVSPAGFNTVHGGTLAGGAQATFSFSGAAGLPILLDLQQPNNTLVTYQIVDSAAGLSPLFNPLSDSILEIPVSLPYSGSYSVVVKNTGFASASYQFRLLDLAAATPVTLGQTVSATLTASYQTDVYRVEGSPGQLLYYDALTSGTYNAATVELTGLAGGQEGAGGLAEDGTDELFSVQTAAAQYLIVSSWQTASVPYSFRLLDAASAAAVTFNTPVSGTLGSSNEAALFQFSGAAGQDIFFTYPPGTFATLYGPDGQPQAYTRGESAASGNGTLTLPSAGTYTLALSGATSYTLDVLTPATNTTLLTDGALVSGTLSTPGQRNQYTFAGAAGDLVFLNGPVSSTNTVTAQLTAPDGTTAPMNGGAPLPEAGTYTLTISGPQPDSYQFRLWDSSAAPLVAANTTVNGTSQFSGDAGLYRFVGTAGERIVVTGSVSATVCGLAGDDLTGSDILSPNQAVLPADGTYLIRVLPDGDGPYPADFSFTVKPLAPTPLTLGTAYTGTLSAANDQQRFTFTGATGQQLYFNTLGGSQAQEYLLDPNGQNLPVTLFGNDTGVFTLPQAGTYTLLARAPATYDFQMLDIAAAPAFSAGSTVSGTLTTEGETALYTFQGGTGQRLSFQNTSDPSVSWQMIGPDGQQVANSDLGSQAFLPAAGAYVFVIQSSATSGTSHYDFQLSDISEAPLASSGFGVVHSGTLAAGASTSFTFTASAGLPVYLDDQNAAGSPISLTLLDPTNSAVLGSLFDYGPAVLPHSGTYTLQVRNSGNASAGFQFRLLDLTQVPEVTNKAVSSTFATGVGTALYSLTATTNEQFVVNPFASNLTNVSLGFIDPDGSGGVAGRGSTFPSAFTLSETGTYYVIVRGAQAGAAPYSFEFDTVAALPALTPGTSVTNLSPPYRLTGSAGQRLYFANTGTTQVFDAGTLYGPANQEISINNSLGTGFLVTLPSSGTYELLPSSTSGTTPYSFQVSVATTTTAAAAVQQGSSGEQITYDPVFNEPTSVTDYLGHETLYQIDAHNGNVVATTQVSASGNVLTHYTYTASGQVQTMTDALGRVTQYDYDALGRLTKITYAQGTPDQASIEYGHDSAGNITSSTDEKGNTTTYQYDAVNRLVQVTDPLNNVTAYVYDHVGNLIKMTAPLGNVTKYSYDKANNLASTTAADGSVTRASYDAAGNLSVSTDALGRQTHYLYDARARLIVTIDPIGGIVSETHDNDNNVITVTNADGHRTGFSYDARDRLTSQTDPLGQTTFYTYDLDNQLIATTDADHHTTADAYDDLNRLVKETDALGNALTLAHDAVGNLISTTDALGHATLYTYDDRNRLVAVTDALGDVTRQTYDAAGNLLSATDPRGNVTTYAYDADNRLIATTNALNGTARLAYDADGNVVTSTDELGRTIIYAYDARNRLTTTTDALGGVTGTAYDAVGNVISVTDPLGNTTKYSYDALNRLVGTTDALGSVARTVRDAAGNVVASTDARGQTTRYAYDAANRLIAVTDALGGVTRYAYDAIGNELSMTDALGRTTRYGYDADNRLTSTTDALGGVSSTSFDAVGNITSTTDALGRVTSRSYDALNRLIKTTDPLDGTVTDTYDADGNLTSQTDQLGRTTKYAYDALNRLTVTTDALSGTVTDTYDAVGNLTSTTDQLGRTTTYAYDALNRRTVITDALGGTVTDSYDADGNLTSETDQLGQTTKYTYDDLNRLTVTADALGGTLTDTYDADGDVTSATDQLGRTTTYSYDALDRLIATTDPLGNTSTESYDAVGNLISSTNPLGRTTKYSYDALDRLTVTTDPLGGTLTDAYDAVGNLVSEADQLGRTTTYTYDSLNRLVAVTDPLGNVSATTYDAVGNMLTSTDPAGGVTQHAYDALNRLTSTTDPDGGVTRDTYDAVGNQLTVTDPGGNTTTSTYDALNRVVKVTDPLGAHTYGYDALGNVIAMTDADGRTTDYTYDALNRETAEIWVDGSGNAIHTFTFGYDAGSELTSAGDPSSAYQFTYDSDGRVSSVSNAGTAGLPAVVTAYGYDAASNVLSRSDTINTQAAGITSYFYDSLNRMMEVSQTGPGLTDKSVGFGYDAASQLTGMTRSVGFASPQQVASSQYAYDNSGRLTALTHTQGTTTVAAYTWSYDAAGRIVADTSADGSDTYGYDKNSQLISAVHSSQANEGYGYDANGNRTNTGYKTGSDNEVLSDGTYNYGYDANGNMISKTDIATGAVTTYSYDYRNRLTEAVDKDHTGKILQDVTYSYDAFNNRIGETVTNYTTPTPTTTIERFVWDGTNVAFTFDGNGNLTNNYLYGAIVGQVLAADSGHSQVLWPLDDNLGSIRDIVSSAGVVQDHITYDSFGNITAQTSAAIDFLFAYTGQQLDSATGLYYDNARFYDAALGRFMTQDPTGFAAGDANLYRYVGNDPTKLTDPTGTQACSNGGEPNDGNSQPAFEGYESGTGENAPPPIIGPDTTWGNGGYQDTSTGNPVIPTSFDDPTNPKQPTSWYEPATGQTLTWNDQQQQWVPDFVVPGTNDAQPVVPPSNGGLPAGNGGGGGGKGAATQLAQALAGAGVGLFQGARDAAASFLKTAGAAIVSPGAALVSAASPGNSALSDLARRSFNQSWGALPAAIQNALVTLGAAETFTAMNMVHDYTGNAAAGQMAQNAALQLGLTQYAQSIRSAIQDGNYQQAAQNAAYPAGPIVLSAGAGTAFRFATNGLPALPPGRIPPGEIPPGNGRGVPESGDGGTPPSNGPIQLFQPFKDLPATRFTSFRQVYDYLGEGGFTKVKDLVPDPLHPGKIASQGGSEIWTRAISGPDGSLSHYEAVRVDPWGHFVNPSIEREIPYNGKLVAAGEVPHLHFDTVAPYQYADYLTKYVPNVIRYDANGLATIGFGASHVRIEPP